MRWRAQEIATRELGRATSSRFGAPMPEGDQDRYTSLDRELERLAKDGRVEVRSPGQRTRLDPSTLLARLEHLEAMRLAERLSSSAWSLSEDWRSICAIWGAQRHPSADSRCRARGSRVTGIVGAGEPLLTRPAPPGRQARQTGRGQGPLRRDEGRLLRGDRVAQRLCVPRALGLEGGESVSPGDLSSSAVDRKWRFGRWTGASRTLLARPAGS